MDVVLKPIMSLLPARKQAARKGKPAAPTGPAASMHHLLYAMRDLNPRFVAIAADLRVVKWPHGSNDRPEIDAHVPEELLVKQRDAADDTAAAKAKRQRRKEKAARKRHRESVRRSRRLRREGGADPDDGASPSPTAADADDKGGDDTDDDGAAAADEDLRKREQQREKERKKRMKGQQTWGFCLTHKGTVTFVDPDGLTKLSATVNRRDMERIEVCGARHCVDATIKGVTVTIVWTLPTNEIQKATKARDRFKAVAVEVLPDVEYADVTPPDEDSDEEPSSELSDDDDGDDDAAKVPSAAAVEERTEGGEEGEGGSFVDADDEEEEEQESDASTEYEEEQEAPEPDEEPLDIAATVVLLKRARDTSADTNRRIFEAQKWLANNPLVTGAAADDAREQQRRRAGSAHSRDDGTDGATGAAASRDQDHHHVLTDRERGLRLSLLVALICDKQRWLHAAAQQRAGDHGIRARYLQSGRRARREAASAPGGASGSGPLSAGGDTGGRFGGSLGAVREAWGTPLSSGFR